MGNWFVYTALLGWIPVVLLLFVQLPPRRAVIAAFLGAWLFLPMVALKLTEGVPVYDKMSATCVGVLLGMVAFDFRRVRTFRPGWIDLPMLIWCLCPIPSSLANDLGLYDGAAESFRQTVVWGLPYFVGRVYFTDLADLKALAVGLFVGGLIYVPLCLFEIKMSPQLHSMVYGVSNWGMNVRLGGWRPTVFMQHGLMVGMWMCMTALVGMWLWFSRALPRAVWRIPAIWGVLALLITAALCKSSGAILLLALGMVGLFAGSVLRIKWAIWALVIIAPLYMVVRAGGLWDGSPSVQVATDVFGEERGGSLRFRLDNEDVLAAKAIQRPIFGWGGWGRARVHDELGRDTSISDGLWIIALGNHGVVGLVSLTVTMLLPAGLVLRRYPVHAWRDPAVGSAIVLAVVVVLYWLDCIPNGMVNPIFTLAAGGLASVLIVRRRAAPRAAVVPQQSVCSHGPAVL